MKLIIGGAFQGKRDYAMTRFALEEAQVCTCTQNEEPDLGRPCLDRLEEFTLWCVDHDVDPRQWFAARQDEWQDSVLICQDIFCGVVPIDARLRQWRQITGQLCQYLSGQAEEVVRIFCGLEQRLK